MFGRFDHVSGAWIENGPERSVKLPQLVPINPRHRAFTLIRVAGMNRNIFYIIGVIVVIVIVLKLLGSILGFSLLVSSCCPRIFVADAHRDGSVSLCTAG